MFAERGAEMLLPVANNFSGYFTPRWELTTPIPSLPRTNAEWMEDILAEQEKVLETIVLEGRRSSLIEMKTGRGKGHIIMKLLYHFQCRSLVLVHNIKTLQEMDEKFKKHLGIEVWLRYSKTKNIQDITIATHRSFADNPEIFEGNFDLLIYDEADNNMSKKMIDAICMSDVEAVFWLTGTPYRQDLDTQDLTILFWPHLKIEGQENNGYNILPEITQVRYRKGKSFLWENFHELKDQLIEDEDRRNEQIKYLLSVKENKHRQLWLLLFDRVEECKLRAERLTPHIDVALVHGTTAVSDDKKNIETVKQSGGIIVATVSKMGRWVDIIEIDNVFLFYPARYKGNIIQAVGRALRVSPWKDTVTIHDWVDQQNLYRQARERRDAYRKEYPGCKIEDIYL